MRNEGGGGGMSVGGGSYVSDEGLGEEVKKVRWGFGGGWWGREMIRGGGGGGGVGSGD